MAVVTFKAHLLENVVQEQGLFGDAGPLVISISVRYIALQIGVLVFNIWDLYEHKDDNTRRPGSWQMFNKSLCPFTLSSYLQKTKPRPQ